MKAERIKDLTELYRRTLVDDVMAFWLRHAPDPVHGGIFNCLDRDGSVYNTDKAMWIQCRAVWMLSKLYNEYERREEWLSQARSGFEFIMKHGFDADGRMYFVVTGDGKRLRKSRYLYTETFGAIACAEYAKASGDERALRKAKELYGVLVDYYRNPGKSSPKVYPETRSTKAHAMPMIMVATTQELRQIDSDPLYKEVVDESLDQIVKHFLKREERALFETVGLHGEKLDSPEGRCLNPGHAIETSWFMLREAAERNDVALQRSALDVLRWSLERGWDSEYGGLLYFVDVEGKPTEQLEWDMKLWWPHTEALYALLLAHDVTGDAVYEQWYERVHAWSFNHFPDAEFGEWYGYLHRDGSVALRLKGSQWKGPFHLPRALLYGYKLLRQMKGEK